MTTLQEVWHTDIVADGYGFGLSIKKCQDGWWCLHVEPDIAGRKPKKALSKFLGMLRTDGVWSDTSHGKADIGQAIQLLGAKWNGWHKESY